MKQNQKNVVLLVTHCYNSFIREQYQRLTKELDSDVYDVVLLYHSEGYKHCFPLKKECQLFSFQSSDLFSLKYTPIATSLVPGSTHFPHLYFWHHRGEYTHYWFIEYDVYFTGSWQTLLTDCDSNLGDYDFLSCHIERFSRSTNGAWPWWLMQNHMGVPFVRCLKGFNPICRYSNRALSCLDLYLRQGYSAHSEVMVTTCLYHQGMKLGDIGGRGEFVPKGWQDKYYLAAEGINNGTMRYRPLYTLEEIQSFGLRNQLFHPLK